jgi:hypothetical protein
LGTHTIEWLLEELEGVEGSSGQYTAWCPCHPDIGTSVKGLSITVTGTGKILCKCHSCGATLTDVIAALEGDDPYGLSEADFKVNITKSRNGKKAADTEANGRPPAPRKGGMRWWEEKTGVNHEVWEELGCVEFENGVAFTFAGMEVTKIRRPPKEFAWIGAGERPPLWPVPEDELPEEVAITEGESDCGTLRANGIHAFAITAGAGKSRERRRYLTEQHFEALKRRGVKRVLLCGDADPSGAEMMAMLADTATACDLEVLVVRLDLVLDPFSGINDLNGIWKETAGEEFVDILVRATHKLSAKMPVTSLTEMMEAATEKIDWLVPDLVAPSDKVLVSGPQKSYKTWVNLDLMRSLVSGLPFLSRVDWTPTRLCKCMVVQEEGSRQLWARRIKKLNLAEDAPVIFWHRKGFKFTDPEKVAALIDTCRREEVEVLFLDPMQRMMPGVNENDSSETGIVWDEVMKIQEAIPGIVVILTHHSNKSERLTWESVRGSSRHAGEVDLGLFLEKHPVEDHTVRIAVDGRDIPQQLGTGESFETRVKISTKEEEAQGTYYALLDGTEIKLNTPNTGQLIGRKNRDIVLAAVEDGADTRTKLMRATGFSDTTVKEHLVQLVEDGEVEEIDNGKGKARTYVRSEDGTVD